MNAFAATAVAFAATAAAALLVWNMVHSLRLALRQDGNLPFFAMLRQRGITPGELEEAVGTAEASRAVRRCVFCASNEACREKLARECPNAPVFERAVRP